jgi:hypothetical protein
MIPDHPAVLLDPTDFHKHGVHPSDLPAAIAELEALGLVEVLGLDENGVPNRFRLSDAWRDIKTKKQARSAKRRSRAQWSRA